MLKVVQNSVTSFMDDPRLERFLDAFWCFLFLDCNCSACLDESDRYNNFGQRKKETHITGLQHLNTSYDITTNQSFFEDEIKF